MFACAHWVVVKKHNLNRLSLLWHTLFIADSCGEGYLKAFVSETYLSQSFECHVLVSDVFIDPVSRRQPSFVRSYLCKSNVRRKTSFRLTQQGYCGTAESSRANWHAFHCKPSTRHMPWSKMMGKKKKLCLYFVQPL